MLQAWLGDVDENVRGEAILCVPRLAEIVLVTSKPERAGVRVLEALLPVSLKLLNGHSPNGRVALATATGDLLRLLVDYKVSTKYRHLLQENTVRSDCKE